MKTTFRDIERLSAWLDGQLPQAEKTRLESRIGADPELAAALEEMRQARALLRRTPQRRAPRNFTLTPKMAGVRPPVPRAAPVLSWASAAAMLLFVFTLGANLLGQFSFGAAAPMMAAQPAMGIGGGLEDEALKATESPLDNVTIITPAGYTLTNAEPPAEPAERSTGLTLEETPPPLDPWLVVWPILASLLLGAALFLRWFSRRAFEKRIKKM
jgi:hypothetical protein